MKKAPKRTAVGMSHEPSLALSPPWRSTAFHEETPMRPRGAAPGITAVRGIGAPGSGRVPTRIEPLPTAVFNGLNVLRITVRCRAAAAARLSEIRG